MFLIDTNCWVQLIRPREYSDSIREFLRVVPSSRVFVTIFNVHSLGNIFVHHKIIGDYSAFTKSVKIDSGVDVLNIPVKQLGAVADACIAHRLDFDDAYQYVAAELNGLKLVSLDADFDRTPNGRLTPAAALQLFKDEQKT